MTPEEIAAKAVADAAAAKVMADKAAADKIAADVAAAQARVDPAHVTALEKELAELRDESAKRRIEARDAKKSAEDSEKARLSAERQKAEAEGRLADVAKLDKQVAENALKRVVELEGSLAEQARRVAELIPFEATAKAEVAALRTELGDKGTVTAGLSDAQALPILRQLKMLSAGPGSVRQTTNANPAPITQAGDFNPDGKSKAEIDAYMATLSPDQIRAFAAKHVPQNKTKRSMFG